MMFLILILPHIILLMGGETQGSSIGSTVKVIENTVMGIGIPKEDHGGHTLYQNLFTVGDPILARSELIREYVSFHQKSSS